MRRSYRSVVRTAGGFGPAAPPRCVIAPPAACDENSAHLDDEQLRKAAKLLNLGDLAESSDIPQFLAIAREASERATTLRPFDVQLLGALRMLAGGVGGVA